jgi:hypothetical protein
MTDTLTEAPPYVEPEPIYETRNYSQGANIITGFVPIDGGPEIFRVGIQHVYVICGQTIPGGGVFVIDAATVQEAFAKLPEIVQEAKRAIENQGRQQMLMQPVNERAAKKVKNGFSGRLSR